MKKTSIRKDVDLFLKSPDYTYFNDISIKEKIIILVKVYILTFIALFLVSIPISLLQKMDVISKMPMKTDLYFNSIPDRLVNFKLYSIFLTILFIPLLEETSYRLFLTKFRVNYFIISVSIFLGMWIEFRLKNIFWIPKSIVLMSVIGLAYILIISTLIGTVLNLFRTKLIRLEEFWNKNTGLIIYSVAILFALGHLNNLKFENRDIVFMPLILMPFFIYGLAFGYLRVRIGIIYSMALHCIFLSLHFGIPMLAALLKSNHPA